MNLSPIERYQQDLTRSDFRHDSAQAAAVQLLQQLYENLQRAWREEERSFGRIRNWFKALRKVNLTPVKGLYLWGGVGRGKTYLMDSFYESLPTDKKMRVHFHRFMRRIHAELKRLEGQKNPLQLVAEQISQETKILCFDEFFVSDITDAMILGTLMEELFKREVTLVATSNIAPEGLYKDGLQRARFLPAIALIKQHTFVVNVDGGVDHRLRALIQANLYHSPADELAEQQLKACFEALVPCIGEVEKDVAVEVEGRNIAARYVAEDVIWFDFSALCDGPRSQNDYIELAKEYQSVLLSGVPSMGRHNDDQARRFVNLIDEFYDRNVKLVISAAQPLGQLYSEGRLGFEFQRTISRLLEMQSQEYLSKPHLP